MTRMDLQTVTDAVAAAQRHGITLVRGAELSTRHNRRSVHLLA